MMKLSLTTFALVLAATPLAAQINPRGDRTTTRSRIETVQDAIEAARRDGRVDDTRASTRGSSKIPRGHLPPRGMCRVWIDGVPPGQQPAVTSCAQAERDRFRYANARVIYGDSQSFPGKGKGKYKNAENQRNCSILDGVVINGRVENVCRDDSVYRRDGRVYDRNGRVIDRNDDWDDDDRDDDRDDVKSRSKSQSKAIKAHAKAQGKAAKKHGKG